MAQTNTKLDPLVFSQIIRRGYNLYRDHFVALFTVTFLINYPLTLLINSIVFDFEDSFAEFLASSYLFGIDSIIGSIIGATMIGQINKIAYIVIYSSINLFIQIVLLGFIVELVSKRFVNEPIRFLSSLKKILIQLPELFLMTVITTLIVLISSILFVLPLLYFKAALMLAPFALIIEKKGLWSSYKRSWKLTSDYRWGIIGLIIVLVILYSLISWVSEEIVLLFLDLWNPYYYDKLYELSMIVIDTILIPFDLFVYLVVYYNQRIKQEGYDMELMSRHFSKLKDDPITEPMSEANYEK